MASTPRAGSDAIWHSTLAFVARMIGLRAKQIHFDGALEESNARPFPVCRTKIPSYTGRKGVVKFHHRLSGGRAATRTCDRTMRYRGPFT
jgi:hypothetical protein